MLRSLKELEKYTVTASDGDLGRVANFIFFREAEWATHCFHLAMTKERIRNSPNIDTDKPVSRQHQRDYFRYYGYPYYWGYSGLWGMGAYPGLIAPWQDPAADRAASTGDVHLRSAKEVSGYGIEGSDGSVGSIGDFLVDDTSWEIRYLVVDTSHWWLGKKVLVAPNWVTRVSWSERKVYVDISREAIRSSPSWNAAAAVDREYEASLYGYYRRPGYWLRSTPSAASAPPAQPASPR